MGNPDPASASLLGQKIGRYWLVQCLGRGGSGEVYVAYDPILDRSVAIKALWRDEAPLETIVDEGRVLARLRHPNVVMIHDVIVSDGRAFLAMEYLRGGDLRSALGHSPSRTRPLLSALIAVGRGLSAAHAAGIVHRDVKPANILVNDDGRLCLSDFGIAGTAGQLVQCDRSSNGNPIGTWSYMPPEQRRGLPPTERSDQYAFCLVVRAALTGQRPDSATTRTAPEGTDSRPSSDHGEPSRLAFEIDPRRSPLSPRLAAVLRRGMSPDPSDRWPSMDALLDAIEQSQLRRRWKGWAAALTVTTLALGVTAASSSESTPCTDGRQHLESVWGPAQRATVEQSIEATGVPSAVHVVSRIPNTLNAYADAWASHHDQTCRALHDAEVSAEGFDLQMACLRRSSDALDATVARFSAADAEIVHNADQLVEGLPSLDRCADLAALRSSDPVVPEKLKDSVAEGYARLAAVEAHRRAGQTNDAWALAQRQASLSEAIDYPPLHAQQSLVEGWTLSDLGRYDDAASRLRVGHAQAIAHRDWDRAFRSALKLSVLVGDRLDRPQEGLVYAELAKNLATALSLPAHEVADVISSRATILSHQGKYQEAADELQRAIAYRDHSGPVSKLSGDLGNLGRLFRNLGRFDEARTYVERVVAERQDFLGPNHPLTGRSHVNLGQVLSSLGEHRAAHAAFAQGIKVLTLTFPSNHPDRLLGRLGLANTLQALGRMEEAEFELRGVIGAAREAPRRSKIGAAASINLANIFGNTGRDDEAVPLYRDSIAALAQHYGEDHPEVAAARSNLAATYAALQRYDEAETEYRRTLQTLESALGSEHPDLVYPLCGLGNLAIERGTPEQGRGHLERCLDLMVAGHPQPAMVASAEFALARSIWMSDPDRARGLALGAQKRSADGPSVKGLDAWLHSH